MVETTKTFTLKSKDIGGQFTQTQFASENFGGAGENSSPELHWENAPKSTKAFAVTIHDLDAPTGGSGLWHWVVYNIPSTVTSLPKDAGSLSEDNLPSGSIGGLNDIGMKGYVGPCPPAGELHRYVITVHALNDIISVSENASGALVSYMLNMDTIAKASLLVYGKNPN